MLVTLPAANIQEKLGKVCGHRFTPASREELKKLAALAPRLKELGVERIICSDLDGQSGAALARRLNVPIEEWQCLRRFNAGKLHATDAAKFQKVYDAIEAPEVPVKGGDSRASFGKRMAAARARLAPLQNILVIADAAVLEELAGAGSAIRYHIYSVELKRGESNKIEAVASAATSSR